MGDRRCSWGAPGTPIGRPMSQEPRLARASRNVFACPAPLRLALLSPKGPLYRRSGIFKQSLRYMPLTLPTLASLIPDELRVELQCIDEGIEDIRPDDIQADLVGMTVITGTAKRAYELSAALRARGVSVVLGGPHVTLVPEDAAPHADAIVLGYAEESFPELLRDFAKGSLQERYHQSETLSLRDAHLPDRSVLPRRRYLTADVFEATRSCVYACEFCVAPSAWGRTPLQKPVERVIDDIRQQKARRAIFVDLNLIADRRYARQLFRALIPLGIQWYGLATTRVAEGRRAPGAARGERLPRTASRVGIYRGPEPRVGEQGLQRSGPVRTGR